MPAFKSAIFLAIGILIGSTFYIPPVAPFISVLLISALIIFLFKDPAKKSFSYTVILLLILFGIFRADISFNILSEHSIARIPDTPEGDQWKITGIINDIPDYDSNKIRFNMDILSIVEEKSIEVEGEIIATIYKSRYNNGSKSPHLKAGDKIEINGRIVTPWGKRNPGEFDYRQYLVNKHIYKTFIAYGYDKVNVISGNNLSFFENNLIFPAKYYAIRNINKNISGDEGEYLKGLITGQRNDISAETKQAFINSGVMHLIAVSGLNVAYVIIIIELQL